MARIPDWLEALVKNSDSDGDNVENSMAAIQTAALMPELILEDCSRLGGIVLTAEVKKDYAEPRRCVSWGGGLDVARQACASPIAGGH